MHVGVSWPHRHKFGMSDYKAESLQFLRRLVEETKKTPTELARLVGVSQTTLTRPLNSEAHKYAVKFQTLQDLSQQTGVPLPASLLSARKEGLGRGPSELRLPIRYEVAAGGFLRRDEFPQTPYGFRVVKSVRPYEHAEQWLERVVSDSMNRLIPEGWLVHVVDAIGIHYRPRHDDVVIVERSHAQGAFVERTVKQVALTPQGAEFWPRSHNPRWAKPISLVEGDEAEDVTVEVVGLVIRAYAYFTEDHDDEG
jgi:transcriptional regulator with XRE-family HTH domain